MMYDRGVTQGIPLTNFGMDAIAVGVTVSVEALEGREVEMRSWRASFFLCMANNNDGR